LQALTSFLPFFCLTLHDVCMTFGAHL
jgi:hypothetical protein